MARRPAGARGLPAFCLTEPPPCVRLPLAPLPRIGFLDVATSSETLKENRSPAEDAGFAARLLRRRAAEAAKGAPAKPLLSLFRIPGDTPGLDETPRGILKEMNQLAAAAQLPQPESS